MVRFVVGFDTPWKARCRVTVSEWHVYVESEDGELSMETYNEDDGWARLAANLWALERLLGEVTRARRCETLGELAEQYGLSVHEISMVCSSCGSVKTLPVLCEEQDAEQLAEDPEGTTYRFFQEEGWCVGPSGPLCADCGVAQGLVLPERLLAYRYLRGEDVELPEFLGDPDATP